MKKVSFISVKHKIPDFCIFPIRKNKKELRESGFDVKVYYDPTPRNLECDVLCLCSKYFSSWWDEGPDRVFAFIDEARKNADRILWFDDADSTGVTHFELLPHVDLYLKKQLLKDRSLYDGELYADRIFSDYYHRNFKIDDDKPYRSRPLDMSLAHKVRVSWHIGLGDTPSYIMKEWKYALHRILPPRYPSHFSSPAMPGRDIDIMFRGQRDYRRNTVNFHRKLVSDILDLMADDFNTAFHGRVPVKQYWNEMKRAKLVVSPFAWGELGLKEFECWISGACLMKPDMSHMETWPDIFIPEETYIPFKWDCSDLEDRIKELLSNDSLRLEVARKGQDAYRDSVSEDGMSRFRERFTDIMENSL